MHDVCYCVVVLIFDLPTKFAQKPKSNSKTQNSGKSENVIENV